VGFPDDVAMPVAEQAIPPDSIKTNWLCLLLCSDTCMEEGAASYLCFFLVYKEKDGAKVFF
jgi:hypothetical protein